MPIPLFLLERIKTSALSGPQVADAFAKLAQVADRFEIDGCAVKIEYVRDDDQLLVSDLVPTITLSLVRQQELAVPANVIDVKSESAGIVDGAHSDS